MIYSGVDLIRTSGQHADQLRKLKGPDTTVTPSVAVEATGSASTSQDDTQNALLRFAKFVKGETKKKRARVRKPEASAVPGGYLKQIQMFAQDADEAIPSLDIYI